MPTPIKAEYIWIDGTEPTPRLRSKTQILSGPEPDEWGFDGSSTRQADGASSDCILKPVAKCTDPLRGDPHILVMCEVYSPDGTPHITNTRALLRPVAERHTEEEPWFGFEQEYTMFRGTRPLGWPEQGYPAPQGPFYCGVGADVAFGREIVEDHLDACITAGLTISGVNAEVMPGQWEFQIGPVPPLAGCHTNFSTKAMRSEGGKAIIEQAVDRLGERHQLHIKNYGDGIEQRLTGLHETCSYKEFRHGDSDRGASIRIPVQVQKEGFGYFEDRRPCANIDPYVVSRLMIETCCDQ
jgi:glutamine synthetase